MGLTDTKVRQAKAADKPYKLIDGNGLFLEVRTTGAKFWRYRYELPPGKESKFTIGEYPAVSLADARAARDWAREQVKAGKSPTAVRELERKRAANDAATTFKGVALEWIEACRADWSEGYAKQIEDVFAADVYPEIGDMTIRDVSAHDMLALLRKIEARGATSIVVIARQRCSSVFRYGVSTLRADTDPTAALKGALKRKAVRHHPHLTRERIPALVEKIDGYGGYLGTKLALRLLMLFFVRTAELRKAEWVEFDLDGTRLGFGCPIWSVPAERMKLRRPHLVPLSRQAVALLTELRTLSGNRTHLFPNLRNPQTVMTVTTINRALELMGYGGQFSGHGFRGTASTALHEMGYESDWIEAQLAHKIPGVRGAYNHALYLPERRKMMQDWADCVCPV